MVESLHRPHHEMEMAVDHLPRLAALRRVLTLPAGPPPQQPALVIGRHFITPQLPAFVIGRHFITPQLPDFVIGRQFMTPQLPALVIGR